MRRFILSLLTAAACLSFATPADAWWYHCRPFRHVHRHYVSFSFGWRSYCPPVRTYVHYHRPVCVRPTYYYHCPPRYIYTPSYCYSSYASPYVVNYNPRSNFVRYNLPPVYQPAELAYGPQAVRQFMGLPRTVQNPPLVQPAVISTKRIQPARAPVEVREVKQSNPTARDRAARYIQFGDDLFRQQRYHEALQRYKSAAAAAPDLAEPFFRQGHALVASNRFELATDAFKRAMSLQPADLDRDDFDLDTLYGHSKLAKNAHVEALARTALARPHDADVLFLVALFLRYDSQADRAVQFFEKAQTLAAGNDAHLRPFLPTRRPDVTTIADLTR